MSGPRNKKKRKPRSDWRKSRRKRLEVAAASVAASALVRVLGSFMRTRALSWELHERNRASDSGIIFAVFHGSHFPVLWAYRHKGVKVIASESADGEILARTMRSLGYGTVRGSSSHGGSQALTDLARLVQGGADVSLAVDGPRGPRHEVKPGIILLGKITGAPVVPVAGVLSRYWQFNSWDKYRLPKPGSRALVVAGEPVFVPEQADHEMVEQCRLRLENGLKQMEQLAQEAVADPAATAALIKQQEDLVVRRREQLDTWLAARAAGEAVSITPW